MLTAKDLGQLRKIMTYVKPHAGLWALGFFFLLITMGTSLLFPKLLGGLMSSSADNLRNNMLQMMGLLAVQGVAGFFRVVLFVMVTERALAAIRGDLYTHLLHLPMSFFTSKRVGELNSRVASDTAQIGETLTTTLAEFLRGLSMVIGGIAILAFTSIKLTLFIVGVIPPLIIVTFIFGRFIRKYAKKVQDEIAESNTIVEETFAGIQTVKAFANEAWSVRYRERIQKVVGLAVTGVITAVPFQALSPSVCSEPSWSFGSGLEWCIRENWLQINSIHFVRPLYWRIYRRPGFCICPVAKGRWGDRDDIFLDGRGAGIGRWRRCYRCAGGRHFFQGGPILLSFTPRRARHSGIELRASQGANPRSSGQKWVREIYGGFLVDALLPKPRRTDLLWSPFSGIF